MVLLSLALLPSGCSDYGFGHPDNALVMDCFDRFYDAEEVDPDPSCQSFEETSTLLNVIEWSIKDWTDIGEGHKHVATQPIAVPLDGDEYPDIVLISHYMARSFIRALSGKDGTPIWSVDHMEYQKNGGLAGGDIDGDGKVEIIVPTISNRVLAFEHDGTLKWQSEHFAGAIPESHAYPAIANLDGKGLPEIIVGSAILDAEGNLLGRGDFGRGGGNLGSTSFAADVDQDGSQEVIVGNAIYDIEGNAIWSNGESDGFPAIADFDRDGVPEIVVSSNGTLRLQNALTGEVIWTVELNGNESGPPTIADFDGDYIPDIGVVTKNRFSMLNSEGALIWEQTITDPSGFLASSAFDFEGDGLPEVLLIDENRLWILGGTNGNRKVESAEHSSSTELEYAIVVDVDNDGEAEIVAPNMPENGGPDGPNSGVSTYGAIDDNWRPARKIWNQHAYSITNVNDDGTIPDTPAANWETFNNFRTGDIHANSGLVMPDLTATIQDLCEFECDAGRIAAWVSVSNVGMADIDGEFTVQMLASTPDGLELLDEVTMGGGVPYGQSLASIKLAAENLENIAIQDILVRVDGGNSAENSGTYRECKEDNNEEWWGTKACEP